MIINADSLLPHLRKKVRPMQSDASRHIICPDCKRRTKLNTLGDGRKKCTVCGKKFRIHKASEETRLRQGAEVLLCFCLDFSPHKTTQITHHRHRLVALFFDHFRRLIAEKNLPQEKLALLTAHKGDIHVVHDKSRCQYCKSKLRPGSTEEKPPVFGVQFKDSGEVYIDPLKDDEAILHFHTFGPEKEAPGRREGYAGFICCGKFHRFTKDKQIAHGTEQLWTWIRERVRSHHGIWKRNTGYYIKELEWKYNNRALDADVQAVKIIDLMPANFLTNASMNAEEAEVQTSDA